MTDTKKGCIIVPYRDRAENLAAFLPHYNKLFPDMRIYVIEQADDKPFNRAKLLNIGFLEYGHHYDYAVYSDVDMLAEDGADYSYADRPTHLATMCSQFNYQMPFPEYFGGVTIINRIDMIHVNGFSNNFWSWGAEDCEMREHIQSFGITIGRRKTIFECFEHPREILSVHYNNNCAMLKNGRADNDGLSSCIYHVQEEEIKEGYTLIKVKL